MRTLLTARFLRVDTHLINLEVIQQVALRKDGSAIVTVPGPRKSLQQVEVPKPFGKELWDFFTENLVVIEFDASRKEQSDGKPKDKVKSAPKENGAPKKKSAPKVKPPKAAKLDAGAEGR